MYGTVQHTGGGTKAVGLLTALGMTAAVGVLVTSMNFYNEVKDEMKTELVIITPPPPPPPVEEIKPVETPKVEAAPAAPELVAPDIDFVIEAPPVIVAPVAEPVPIPDPIPVAPTPAVGTDRISPKLRAGDKPAYPSASLRASEQGTTQLEVCVSAQGRVTSVNVTGSSGFSRLDDAAAKWLRGERFSPGTVGGIAQSVCGHQVTYQWNLQDAK